VAWTGTGVLDGDAAASGEVPDSVEFLEELDAFPGYHGAAVLALQRKPRDGARLLRRFSLEQSAYGPLLVASEAHSFYLEFLERLEGDRADETAEPCDLGGVDSNLLLGVGVEPQR
jgi:hypothetical protein